MSEDVETLFEYEISFEEWKKLMKNLITTQKEKLKMYKEKSKEYKTSFMKNYIKERINEFESLIMENIITLEIAERHKDFFLYFVDSDGSPKIKLKIPSVYEKEKRNMKSIYI